MHVDIDYMWMHVDIDYMQKNKNVYVLLFLLQEVFKQVEIYESCRYTIDEK